MSSAMASSNVIAVASGRAAANRYRLVPKFVTGGAGELAREQLTIARGP